MSEFDEALDKMRTLYYGDEYDEDELEELFNAGMKQGRIVQREKDAALMDKLLGTHASGISRSEVRALREQEIT